MDCILAIFDHINDPIAFKSAVTSCKSGRDHFYERGKEKMAIAWNEIVVIASPKYWEKVRRFSNHVAMMVWLTGKPPANDDYDKITEDFIDAFPDIRWDWDAIARKSDISLKFVIKHKIFYDVVLACNKNITIGFIRANTFSKTEWSMLMMNSVITRELIEDNPDINWPMRDFIYNPNVTLEHAIEIIGGNIKDLDRQGYSDEQLLNLVRRSKDFATLDTFITAGYIGQVRSRADERIRRRPADWIDFLTSGEKIN